MFIVLLFFGCGARTGAGVKEYNLIKDFDSPMNYQEATNTIYYMSKYCASGLYKYNRKDFEHVNKSVVYNELDHMSVKSYYMSIEIEANDNNTSHIKVYHYYNRDVERNMANLIKQWVTNNSTECLQGVNLF